MGGVFDHKAWSSKGAVAANDLEVGAAVWLTVDSTLTEFLIVHHGNPDSTEYAGAADGVWLLAKDLMYTSAWGSSNNTYSNSKVRTFLEETYYAMLDSSVQELVNTVLLPYCTNTQWNSYSIGRGENGLSSKVFLLSLRELGYDASKYAPTEGVPLSYFNGADNSAKIAYFESTAKGWWTRSRAGGDSSYYQHATYVTSYGEDEIISKSATGYVRPAFIISNDAMFTLNASRQYVLV